MEKRYYLHRISHEWDWSKPLLDMGFLSIGWGKYKFDTILEVINEYGESGFNEFMFEQQNTARSRWSLWYFSQMKPGDIVVVPLYDKQCSIVEVVGNPQSIVDLAGTAVTSLAGESAVISEEEGLKDIDLGFVVKIKVLKTVPRNFCKARLVARMKVRNSTVRIDNISDDVEAALSATQPVSISQVIQDTVIDNLRKEVFSNVVTPDVFEKIIAWYMKKTGADVVWIPAKNQSGKTDGADADVIAEYSDLHIRICIQAKKHDKESHTDSWCIEQITKYVHQFYENDEYSTVPWVITTAEDFDISGREDMETAGTNVRLVNGKEFIQMLLNVGFRDIDSAVGQ